MKTKLSILFVFLSVILFSYVIFLTAYPYNVIKINNLPFPVVTKEVLSGGSVVIDIDYCKYMNAVAHYSVQFINQESKEIINLEERYISNFDKGCDRINFFIKTPRDMPTGKYTLKIILNYKVNPLREVQYTFLSEEFTVFKSVSLEEKIDQILTILDNWELDE